MFFLIRHIVLDRLLIWFSSFEKPPSRALQKSITQNPCSPRLKPGARKSLLKQAKN